jgi:hypothetical protein
MIMKSTHYLMEKISQMATFWPLIDSIFLEQPIHIHPLLGTLHMTFDFAL